MKSTRIVLTMLCMSFLVSLYGQKDDVQPGNGGNHPHSDCYFKSDVQLIGEQDPVAGQLYNYALVNADPNQVKRWKVIGAYEIDGQLVSNGNNEVVKPGNTITVIWDGQPGINGGVLPNGKIIVEKEPSCPGAQALKQVTLPVRPVTPNALKCSERVIVDDDVNGSADSSYVCPFDEHKYKYAGGACTNPSSNGNFTFTVEGADEYSIDGGTTWLPGVGVFNLLTVDADSILIRWMDEPVTRMRIEPTNGNSCCRALGLFPHNRAVSARIFVRGWDMNVEGGFGVNDRELKRPWAVLSPLTNFAVNYKTIIFDPNTTPLKQYSNTIGDFPYKTMVMEDNPAISRVYWETNSTVLFGLPSIKDKGPFSPGNVKDFFLEEQDAYGLTSAVATVSFLDGACYEQFVFKVRGIYNDPCTDLEYINGDNIVCSDPNAVLTYTVDGGNNAGAILWDLPPSWTPVGNNWIQVPYPKNGQIVQYWANNAIPNSHTIQVQPNGNPGTIEAVATAYTNCIQPKGESRITRNVIVEPTDIEIRVPLCNNVGTTPNFRVLNGELNTQYSWQFFDANEIPLNVGNAVTSFEDGVVNDMTFPDVLDIPEVHILVTSNSSCTSYGYTTEGAVDYWIGSEAPLPLACQGSGSFVPVYDNGIGQVGENVDESMSGLGSSNYTSNIAENDGVTDDLETVMQEERKTEVYPNPASSEIYIKGKFDLYKVFSQQGSVILEGNFNNNEAFINCRSFPVGTYFIQLIGKENVERKKISIIR